LNALWVRIRVSEDTHNINFMVRNILSTTDADIDSLFTHQFELNDTKEAMELTRTSKGIRVSEDTHNINFMVRNKWHIDFVHIFLR
jgi:hypothetical protein